MANAKKSNVTKFSIQSKLRFDVRGGGIANQSGKDCVGGQSWVFDEMNFIAFPNKNQNTHVMRREDVKNIEIFLVRNPD